MIHTPLSPFRCEFPQVAPTHWGREHNKIVIANFSSLEASLQGIQDQLTLIDTQKEITHTISLGEGTYTGEALLVPKKSNTQEAWVLAVGFDTRQKHSALYILDTEAFMQGPIAKIPYPGILPFSFHGHWWPKS